MMEIFPLNMMSKYIHRIDLEVEEWVVSNISMTITMIKSRVCIMRCVRVFNAYCPLQTEILE